VNFNATFIGQIVAFAIFIYLTYRYVWPPIVAAMAERSKRIADGLQIELKKTWSWRKRKPLNK
jgi:F-type H+-transporting ATPase subunit b